MINRGLIYFYLARVIGLGFKPFILWYLLKYNIKLSNEVAQYFFVTASFFVFLNNGSHIEFYKLKFNQKKDGVDSNIKSLYKYLYNIISHSLIMLVPLTAFIFILLSDWRSAFIYSFFVMQEKLWDEVQRYQIFSEKFKEWSIFFIIKILVILSAIYASVILNISLIYAIICILTPFYLVITKITLDRYLKIPISNFLRRISFRNFKLSITYYFQYGLGNQLLSISSTNIMLIDKWMIEKSEYNIDFAKFVLLGHVGSIFLVLIDNIYFTRHRKKYISKTSKIRDIFNFRGLILISTIYFIIAALILMLFKNLFHIEGLTNNQIAMALIGFVIFGVSKPYSEFLYWRTSLIKLALIDAFFIVMMIAVGYCVLQIYGLDFMYIVLSVLMIFRLFALFSMCKNIS